MTTWLTEALQSHRVQLGVTAVAATALGATAILGLQAAKQQYRVADLKESIPELNDHEHDVSKIDTYGGAATQAPQSKQDAEDARSIALAARARAGDYDEDLVLEQLARNRIFLTDKGLNALRSAFIIIVGCGGVGSHAAAALARSGAGRLRLIDFDQVTLSSLNRHSVATLADVGTPKVHCLSKRLSQIVPWTHFEPINELFNAGSAERLLGPSSTGQTPTFVIDAIDNIDCKVDLLHYCATHDLPVISSMGAGCKSDPTRIFIGDISATTDDALSKSTRRRLRMRGVASGVACVYSQERPGPGKAVLQPLDEALFTNNDTNGTDPTTTATNNPGDLSVLPDFRVRILPVLGTMPATFGLAAANHVILRVAGYPADETYLPSKAREKAYEALLSALQGSEERVARATGVDVVGMKCAVDVRDVGYLFEEIWCGRSVVSGLGSRMVLVRWRKPAGGWVDSQTVPGQKLDKLGLAEVVLMTKEEGKRHEKEVLIGGKPLEEVYPQKVIEKVKRKLEEEEKFFAHYR